MAVFISNGSSNCLTWSTHRSTSLPPTLQLSSTLWYHQGSVSWSFPEGWIFRSSTWNRCTGPSSGESIPAGEAIWLSSRCVSSSLTLEAARPFEVAEVHKSDLELFSPRGLLHPSSSAPCHVRPTETPLSAMTSWVRDPETDGQAGGFPLVSIQSVSGPLKPGRIWNWRDGHGQHVAPLECKLPWAEALTVLFTAVFFLLSSPQWAGSWLVFTAYLLNMEVKLHSPSHQTELSRTSGQASVGKL